MMPSELDRTRIHELLCRHDKQWDKRNLVDLEDPKYDELLTIASIALRERKVTEVCIAGAHEPPNSGTLAGSPVYIFTDET